MRCHKLPCAGGGHVSWRSLGEGPPLVLLHGGHGSWQHWQRNLAPWSHGYQLWVPDMPGYGDSSPPPAPTLDALLANLRETLDAAVGPLTAIRLVGFSFGGLVATHLAALRPGVEALALLGPAGHGGARRPRGTLRSWREALDSGDQAALRAIMTHNLQLHMLAHPADAEAVQLHTDACLRTRFHSKTLSRRGGLADGLRRLHCPVLLLWGEHDVTGTPTALAPALAAACAQAEAHIIPGAAHWVQYEAAEAVNALVADWLGRATAAPIRR